MLDRKQEAAIRAEGAELYVRAVLMLELGLPVSLASRNMPGYDLLVHHPTTGDFCRVQVKYRSAIDSDGARVKSFDFDVMAYVAGNVGRIGSAVPLSEAPRRPTEVFLIPVEVVRSGMRKLDLFPSPTRGRYEAYRDAWHVVPEFLGLAGRPRGNLAV